MNDDGSLLIWQQEQYLERLRQLRQQLEQAATNLQQELNTAQREIDTVDSSNEFSEETSLELQLSLDRGSKFLDTLSNILKQISETANNIVKNNK